MFSSLVEVLQARTLKNWLSLIFPGASPVQPGFNLYIAASPFPSSQIETLSLNTTLASRAAFSAAPAVSIIRPEAGGVFLVYHG